MIVSHVFENVLLNFDIGICADQFREQFLFSITILLLTCAAR